MKYIAIKVKQSSNMPHLGVAGIEIRSSNGTNILIGSTATATNSNPGHNPSMLLDSDDSTAWLSSDNSNFARIAFALPNEFVGTISSIILSSGGVPDRAPIDFEVQVSDTGDVSVNADWSTIFSTNLAQGSWNPFENKQFDFTYIAVSPVNVDAEKLRMGQITLKLKLGEFITDDDSVFYVLGGNTELSVNVMNALDTGGGYNELRALSLSDSTALRVLSIFNVKLDTFKYESEKAFERIVNQPELLQVFFDYLATNGITEIPSLESYIAKLRSNHEIYQAARAWNAL